MAIYKPPGTYARFIKTASPTATAVGNSRIMALVGTGINYYTVTNEAVTKSNSKPYDTLAHSNVFEVLSVTSRPIYDNISVGDNINYKETSSTNKGYRYYGNIIAWDSLVEPSIKINYDLFPHFYVNTSDATVNYNIEAYVDENAEIPMEDGEWMIEASYINEDDVSITEGNKQGCYRIINVLTSEIVGEYVVSNNPVENEDGTYPIPGLKLTVKNTYIEDSETKKPLVSVGDYIKITTTAAKTEVEAQAYKELVKSEDFDLHITKCEVKREPLDSETEGTATGPIQNINLEWDKIVGGSYSNIYVSNTDFMSNDDNRFNTDNAYAIENINDNAYTINKDTLQEVFKKTIPTFAFKTNLSYDKMGETIEKIKITIVNNLVDGYTYQYQSIPYPVDDSTPVDESTIPFNNIEKQSVTLNAKDNEKFNLRVFKGDSNNPNIEATVTISIEDAKEKSNFIAELKKCEYDKDEQFYVVINVLDKNGNITDFIKTDMNGITSNSSNNISNSVTSADNTILYNAIDKVVVINNDTLYEKSAIYRIKYIKAETENDEDKFLIERYVDGIKDETFRETESVGQDDYFEVIPGINFEVDTLQLAEITDSETVAYIVTSPRITSTEIPSEGSTYYVSYKYRKSEADYEPRYFNNYDDIVAAYGNYDVSASASVLNSLSLGAEIAFNNGVSAVVCVQAKNSSDYEMQTAIDKLTKTIAEVSNFNTIVPLTTSSVVGAYLKNHVNLMSSYEYGKERMGYLAGAIKQPIYKNATKSDRSIGLVATAEGYSDERIVYVVPGAIRKSIRDLRTGKYNTRTLPGCYAAVAVAAIGLSNDPAEPLTNKTISGFTELVDLYSESEKNVLAGAGCCVLEHSGSNIKIRHGITTFRGEVNSEEITLIQIKDYVIDACRTTSANSYIGKKLTSSIVGDVQHTMEMMLNQFISQGIIINFSSLSVKRNSAEPRQIDVKFEIEAVYPLNWINIEFGFSAVS